MGQKYNQERKDSFGIVWDYGYLAGLINKPNKTETFININKYIILCKKKVKIQSVKIVDLLKHILD